MSESKWIDRVNKLFAKAEDLMRRALEAPNDEEEVARITPEYNALINMAMKIMAEKSITDAMLASAGGEDILTDVRKPFEMPYSASMRLLYSNIASAFRCRAIQITGSKIIHIFGFTSDIEKVDNMFGYLQRFGDYELRAAILNRDPFAEALKSFTSSFWKGFAFRLSERMKAMMAEAKKEAEISQPGSALVLVTRSQQVEVRLGAEYPRLRTVTTYSTSNSGYNAGKSAADRAPLSMGGSLGGKTALSGPPGRRPW